MIYLYIKTHNKTGLKYFGKTTRKNPHTYNGSGVYWKKHLKKHGNDVSTEIIGEFISADECKEFALNFSKKYNITESLEWANLKDENGLDGNPQNVKFTREHKEKIRKSRLGKCYNNFDDETRKKMSIAAKKRNKKQVEQGNHHFSGELGSIFASNRNKKLLKDNKHNFKNNVFVIDKNGNKTTITLCEFKSQEGPKNNWKYVHHTSKEAKKRQINSKGYIK